MQLYRISSNHYIRDLSGEGARIVGGRWNSKGVPVLYTASSRALATLEILVHTPFAMIPKHLSLAVLEVPDSMEVARINAADLPYQWRDYPAPKSLAQLGDQWIREMSTLMMKVPSAVVPQEDNYLINPRHPDFKLVQLLFVEPFQFDVRLFPDPP